MTPQDYEILLLNEGNILLARAFGASNEPTKLRDLYNQYLNPLDAWIYIIPDNIGRVELLPSKYNKFEWASYNNQNRFNEIYKFNSGDYNNRLFKNNNDIVETGTEDSNSYNNYIILNTPENFNNYYSDNNTFKMKISNTLDSNQQFKSIPDLIVGDTIRILAGDTMLNISENINAYFESSIDIDNGINLSTNNKIKLNIDKQGDTEINISSLAIDNTKVRPEEISASINKGLEGFGNGYGSSSGLSGVSSIIEKGDERFIKLTSPRTGDSSFVIFHDPSGDTATNLIFGNIAVGDTKINYGKKTITFIGDSNKLIYENGSLNLNDDVNFYIHYLTGDTNVISFGNYFTNAYTLGDPEYRTLAKRVYNTVYEEGDTTNTKINFNSSVFPIKFTKKETDYHSINKIEDDWPISHAEAPKIESITSTSSISLLSSTAYNLRFRIDGQSYNTIDITGDNGSSASYELKALVNNINTTLQTAYSGDTYTGFTYAYIDENKIIITSATKNENSKIQFSNANVSNNALNALFGLSNNTAYNFKTTGDYYFRYNTAIDCVEMVKLPDSDIPDLNFYIHYIWDRRSEKTLEDNYQIFLKDKKILGINNIFKQVFFSTFDVIGEVFYNSEFGRLSIKDAVENLLKNEFNLLDKNNKVKAEIGKSIHKSKVLQVIASIPGVEYINIHYFGKNAEDTSTNEDLSINSNFDEVIIVSENVINNSNRIIHGINLTYTKA